MKLVVLLAVIIFVVCQKDVGLQFDEFMSGYFAEGDLPYERAYEIGRLRNQRLR